MDPPVNNQEEFTAKVQESLERIALENAKTIAAQLTAMVVIIQSGQKPNAVLFFEKPDIPDEFLDMCDNPFAIDFMVLIPSGVEADRWLDETAGPSEIIKLPNGEILVFGEG